MVGVEPESSWRYIERELATLDAAPDTLMLVDRLFLQRVAAVAVTAGLVVRNSALDAFLPVWAMHGHMKRFARDRLEDGPISGNGLA